MTWKNTCVSCDTAECCCVCPERNTTPECLSQCANSVLRCPDWPECQEDKKDE